MEAVVNFAQTHFTPGKVPVLSSGLKTGWKRNPVWSWWW